MFSRINIILGFHVSPQVDGGAITIAPTIASVTLAW
jgi:hypothetical protein